MTTAPTDKTDMQAKAVPAATPKKEEGVKDTLHTVLLAVLIAFAIRTLAFGPFNIPSSSMVPTLLVGDYLFVSKYSYGYGSNGTFFGLPPFEGRVLSHTPQRGDVVVFKWPGDNSTDYIKRLIGLPGDTVQMRQGILYINGVPVERDRMEVLAPTPGSTTTGHATDYLEHLPGGVTHIIRKEGENMPLDNTEVFTVPAHHYFFMGDNRDNSSDSRDPRGHVGYVDEGNLVGKAEFIFFSLKDDTSFWQLWRWPTDVRWNRLFTGIH